MAYFHLFVKYTLHSPTRMKPKTMEDGKVYSGSRDCLSMNVYLITLALVAEVKHKRRTNY